MEKIQFPWLIGESIDNAGSGCRLGARAEWEWADRVEAVMQSVRTMYLFVKVVGQGDG